MNPPPGRYISSLTTALQISCGSTSLACTVISIWSLLITSEGTRKWVRTAAHNSLQPRLYLEGPRPGLAATAPIYNHIGYA